MENVINDVSLLGDDVKLYTKKEMAAVFGVTYRTIERWYNSGYINRIRIGGRIYFSSSEVYRLRDQFLTGKPQISNVGTPLNTIADIRKQQQESQLFRQ